MAKPSLPQGTRDFDAITVRKRQYIFNTIKTVFELYGFQPLETPAMENLETLMGKYGDEGDKLIFKILDSGNPFDGDFIDDLWSYAKDFNNQVKENQEKNNQEVGFLEDLNVLEAKNFFEEFASELRKNKSLKDNYSSKNLVNLKNELTEKALRYDLTIPFARYVAMNHGKLTFPFKRYQMQPVWRGDKPQHGRYREFYQCDADVVGSKSLLNELELANIYADVFNRLGIAVEIRINNRKILASLAEICGGADKMIDITIAIDKLDKIGIEKVKEELIQRGLFETQINTIEKYLLIQGFNKEKIKQLKNLIGYNENGNEGIKEIEYLLNNFQLSNEKSKLVIDFTLARGLNYYTGIIFEIKAVGSITTSGAVVKEDIKMGSIGGGGRYDNLTGTFGVPDIAGVGISFGVDRIYDVMEGVKLFPTGVNIGTQVLFFNSGEIEAEKAFTVMQQLRAQGTRCELFHEKAKFDKQFKYAERKSIPYVVYIDEKELHKEHLTIKDLRNGVKETLLIDALVNFTFQA